MTLIHDAYLFHSTSFIEDIAHLFEANPDDLRLYEIARAKALSIYSASAFVRSLVDLYGGWNLNALSGELPEKPATVREAWEFCLTIILYNHLTEANRQDVGLGNRWAPTTEMLKSIGISEDVITSIVRGKPLASLAPMVSHMVPNESYELVLNGLSHLRPRSQNGCVGGLSIAECNGLRGVLFNHKVMPVHLLQAQKLVKDTHITMKDFERVINMLDVARTHNSDLCLIISG